MHFYSSTELSGVQAPDRIRVVAPLDLETQSSRVPKSLPLPLPHGSSELTSLWIEFMLYVPLDKFACKLSCSVE